MNNDHIAYRIKALGEDHYKTGGVEPIDLMKSITPHPSLDAGDVLALTSLIRYASRMLMKGLNAEDVRDCGAYAEWLKYWLSGKEASEDTPKL